MVRATVVFFLFLLSACTVADDRLQSHAENLQNYSDFGVCSGYGCSTYQQTGLTEQEWQSVSDLFSQQEKSPAQEREEIARAIALIEQFIGPKTGTAGDKARAVVLNFSTRGQMDCIDEAINSTSYIYLMRKYGLIKLHTLGGYARRNIDDLSYPHSSATIHEIGKQKTIGGDGHFVVDSWFHQNGAEAEVLPVSQWQKRWYPKETRSVYNFSAS